MQSKSATVPYGAYPVDNSLVDIDEGIHTLDMTTFIENKISEAPSKHTRSTRSMKTTASIMSGAVAFVGTTNAIGSARDLDMKSIDSKIQLQILLVGPFPQYITSSLLFRKRVKAIADAVKSLELNMDSVTLAALSISRKLQLGSGTPQATDATEKHRKEAA